MLNGFLYGADRERFAIVIEHIFRDAADDARYSTKGIRGRKWLPLNLVAFVSSFVGAFIFRSPLFLTSFFL